jgi:hypothetical protein
MAKQIIDFDQHRNDLFAKFFCDACRKNGVYEPIKLTGYNDNNFFQNVNKDFRELNHAPCGTTYLFKWTPDGVIVKLKGDK